MPPGDVKVLSFSASQSRPIGLVAGRVVVVFGCLFALSDLVSAADGGAIARYRDRAEPILLEYCSGCHTDGVSKGNVAFDTFESDDALLANRDLWLSVLKNVRSGIMPPAGSPRPKAEEKQALAEWIKRDAFGLDPRDPDPGRVTIRRLNRTEYRNTIRDLMGIEFRTDEEFPPDDTGYGFDNIGDVLSTSPLLLEKYMQAAETIVATAVPTVSRVVPERSLGGDKFKQPDSKRTGERMTFYEPAEVARTIDVDRAGEYVVAIDLEVDGAFNFDPGKCRVAFSIDGQSRFNEEFAWHDNKRFHFEFQEKWSEGEHRLAFALEPLTPVEEKKTSVDLRILSVQLQGPLDRQFWTRTKNYERFFSREDPPDDPTERQAYAREVLSQFAAKAFRRPADPTLVDRLVTLAESIDSLPGRRFEEGVAQAMVAVLASPRFLFRVEEVVPATAESKFALLDDYALASRLSYFLWSTMPDEELFRLAELGTLRERVVPQVRRMLADPRSDEFIKNFVGQWLQVRDIQSVPINSRVVLRRDGVRAKDDLFDADLRRAMRQESEMVFGYIVHEDRSVLELLDSNYTFVNDKLARHYGIGGVEGRQLRKVELEADSPRGGILTQGAILCVTSNPTRTSPVKRGLFVLDNILGTPAPPPPAAVPELEASEKEFKGREPTMRELMELHRAKPLCSSCHARMDPLGLGLENFNALGMWRESERDQPIDTKGQLITGETFTGIRELKQVLTTGRRGDFYHCLTEKVLTYALGRGLEYSDIETVDAIVDRLEREGGSFSALLDGIVESAAFQKRRNAAK